MLVDTVSIWVAVAAGVFIFVLFSLTRINYLRFKSLKQEAARQAKEDELDVTVIIPARNEERVIANCVKSLPKLVRVIVVNDHSDDGTAKRAEDEGVEVLHLPPVKRNTVGKAAACFFGSEHVKTKYILFVDADTRFKPEFLPTLIGYANANSLAMVSLLLKRQHPNFLSAMFMPYAYAMYFAGVSQKNVHSLHLMKWKNALASGHCILFRADAYAFTGGHRSIINEVLDGIELGALAKRHRLKFEIMRGERLGSVRMYESSVDTMRGFQKNTMRLLSYNRLSALMSVLTTLAPLIYIPVLLGLWTDIEEDWVVQTMAVFAVVPFLPLLAWYPNLLRWVLTPLIAYLFPMLMLNCVVRWLMGGKAVWKGRKV